MDIAKYLNMLTTESLWFSRSDVMGDPFEGSTTQLSKADNTARIRSMVPDGDEAEGIRTRLVREDIDFTNFVRSHIYINSWHLSAHESAAMWRQYSKDFGISITTTLDRIKGNLVWPNYIYPGLVNYTNYEAERLPQDNFLWPYVHKRHSFEYEKEIRLVIPHNFESLGDYIKNMPSFDQMCASNPVGLRVSANLKDLILGVYIDPTAPSWFFEVVQAITKKYGYSFEVKQSSLSSDPVY